MAGKLAKLAQHAGFTENVVEVWAENMEAVAFFLEYCRTQWRVGFNGPTGLDHTAVISSLRTLRLPRDRFDEVFGDVRVMERAGLEEMAKK